MLDKADKRIARLVKNFSGDKLNLVLLQAEDLMLTKGKSLHRALADALEMHNLV